MKRITYVMIMVFWMMALNATEATSEQEVEQFLRAARLGDEAAMKHLLDSGVSINAADNIGTALHHVINCQSPTLKHYQNAKYREWQAQVKENSEKYERMVEVYKERNNRLIVNSPLQFQALLYQEPNEVDPDWAEQQAACLERLIAFLLDKKALPTILNAYDMKAHELFLEVECEKMKIPASVENLYSELEKLADVDMPG